MIELKKPDFLFQKALMILGLVLFLQATILGTTGQSFWILFLLEYTIGLCIYWLGIWLIDWEAKLYYKALRRRQHEVQ